MGPREALVALAFFLSGLASLIYEVVWVRQFGNLFGNTIVSAAAVTALLMAGLGVGAWLAGWLVDRRTRAGDASLVAVYAALELAIGLSGVALAASWPRLETLSASMSSYVVGPHGWFFLSAGSQVARFALAGALVFPIGLAMGATLPVLVKALTRGAAVRIGLLYGINTLGAAAGAFLVDAVLIPRFGLYATQLVAASLNTLAAGSAAIGLALAYRSRARGKAYFGLKPVRTRQAPRIERSDPAVTAGALVVSGFVAMGLQILWFRDLSGVVGSYRSVFSVLLFVILVALALGSWLGGWLADVWRRPRLLFMATQACLAVATAACLVLSYGREDRTRLLAPVVRALEGGRGTVAQYIFLLRHALRLVFAPALCLGLSYPVANAMIQDSTVAMTLKPLSEKRDPRAASLGARAGLLYLANTFGAVAGSLTTAFVLLPFLGVQASAFILILCTVFGIVVASRAAAIERPSARARRRLLARWSDWSSLKTAPLFESACIAVAFAALIGFGHVRTSLLLEKTNPPLDAAHGRYLTMSEGLLQSIAVVEEPDGSRILKTNGHSMSGTDPESSRYMRAFVHLPLAELKHPEKALVICFGVGNTLGAASLYRSLTSIEVADLSRDVLEHASWFSGANHDVLKDPRVSVFVNDGRQHLRMQPPETYDLITLEPPPISYAGVSSLYSEEFYRLARSRLKPGGYMTQWLPYYEVPEAGMRAIVRAFVDVFPNATLHAGSLGDLILMGRNDGGGPNEADPAVVEETLKENPEVAADLSAFKLRAPIDFFGTFVGSPRTLARLSGGQRPVTDDDPLLEHSVVAVVDSHLPDGLLDASDFEAWCPTCRLAHMQAYAEILKTMHAWHRDFSEARHTFTSDQHPVIAHDPSNEAAVRSSDYLTSYWTKH